MAVMGRSKLAALTHGVLALWLGWATVARAAPVKKIVVTGVLDVLQEDDFEHGKTRRIYRLIEENGERVFVLKFRQKPKDDLVTGMKVRVRGDAADTGITADGDPGGVVVLAEAATAPEIRKAVALIVDFAGDATGTGAGTVSCSAAQVADLLYTRAQSSGGNFDQNYDATSYNQLSWEPDADGLPGADVFRVTIGASTAESCSSAYGTWASKADSAATAAGVDLSRYQHRIYVVPNGTNCSWAGLANVGCGSGCRAWVKGSSCNTLDIYVHEVGHNLGMGHSSTDVDNNGAIDSTCSYWGTSYSGGEYCDRSDFMGIGGDGKRHNNGPHKLQMGWVPLGKIVDTSSGTYTLAPLGTDPSATADAQLLRVARSAGGQYYVSYRTNAAPYEDNLRTEYQQKTFVHTHSGGSSNTLLVATLGDGQSFSEPASGITITQAAHSASAASVQVNVTCTPAAPAVVLSPSSSPARPGDTVAYTVLVTNRDSSACPGSTLALSAMVPSGWVGSLSSASVTLSAGQQGSTTLTVTSAGAVTDGSYPVSATATDMTGPDLSGSGSGSAVYCVDAIGPGAVTDLTGVIKQKTRVQLTWGVPSATGCAALASYDVYRNGGRIATTSNTSYLDTGTSTGQTYAYTVIARDTLGNASGASNVVTITIGGSSGAKENCTNRVDDDGDGLIDCLDSDCQRNRVCR